MYQYFKFNDIQPDLISFFFNNTIFDIFIL